MNKTERHRTERIGWLRAAVLGANDGILSTSSLVLGVAAATRVARRKTNLWGSRCSVLDKAFRWDSLFPRTGATWIADSLYQF
jgi:hypothetical protein